MHEIIEIYLQSKTVIFLYNKDITCYIKFVLREFFLYDKKLLVKLLLLYVYIHTKKPRILYFAKNINFI